MLKKMVIKMLKKIVIKLIEWAYGEKLHTDSEKVVVAHALAHKTIELYNHCRHSELSETERCLHLSVLADIARQITSDTRDTDPLKNHVYLDAFRK